MGMMHLEVHGQLQPRIQVRELWPWKIRRGIQPQGVQIPLKTPSTPPCTPQPGHQHPPPPGHGGWPSPARPSRMKFQPRPRFEALAVRGGRIFRSKWCFCCVFVVLEASKAPGGPWRPLEAPGGPWTALEAPARPWSPLQLHGNSMDEAK